MSLKDAENRIIKALENPDGKSVLVVFYDRDILDHTTGKRVTKTYVKKRKDIYSVYDCIAREEDINQSPAEYQRYLDSRERRLAGTALKLLPEISPSQVLECETNGIYTVESLCQAPDHVVKKIHAEYLQKHARDYLSGENQKDKEIQRLKAELEALKNDSTNNSPKRRGRKPSVREADISSLQ